MADVLLLNPPITHSSAPSISIPALAGHLKSHGFDVQAYDLNREFFCRFLSPSNILNGLRHAETRLMELNDQLELSGLDSLEFARLAEMLHAAARFKKHLGRLRTGMVQFDDLQRFGPQVRKLFAHLASAPYFPEGISLAPILDYTSRFKTFSTEEILEAVNSRAMFGDETRDMIEELLAENQPSVVGISAVANSQLMPGFFCAGIVKRLAPEVHVTVGGPAVFIFMREVINPDLFQVVDSLVMDEGEIPLQRLLEEIQNGRPNLASVPGLKYLDRGRVSTNPSLPPPDLGVSPVPDFTVFQLDRYFYTRETMLIPFQLSRGCFWGRCSFCRTELPLVQRHQQPDVDVLYDQLKRVIAENGFRSFLFSDESCHPQVLARLCARLLEDGLSIDWIGHTRVSRDLTRERCELYRRAGCQALGLGIESLHDRILKMMQKGITTELVDEVLRQIAGEVPVLLYMIVGFPTETEEEALSGFARVERYLNEKLIKGYSYSPLVVGYGSDMWRNPERYGISAVRRDEGCDLLPDSCDFDCDGMSRDKASELCLRFNKRLLSPVATAPFHEVSVRGQTVRLNRDVDEAYTAVGKDDFAALQSSYGDVFRSFKVYRRVFL